MRELKEELGFTAAHDIEPPLMITCTTTVRLTAGHTDVSLWYIVHASRVQEMKYDETEFSGIRWFPVSMLFFWKIKGHPFLSTDLIPVGGHG
ncbi:NUDIX hydrolase [Candidatus Methylospira mobilis]|uniref:NUDIX hydrolase n=1 Tax=Candidatus Methylospira mobilis TaxID=1808979 RepID=A0A5Q0BKH3_9GAMM|nr:NUDIX hydrolase [Candidatus Methylospira mobilis]